MDEIVPNSPGGRRESKLCMFRLVCLTDLQCMCGCLARQSELARPSVVGIDYNLEGTARSTSFKMYLDMKPNTRGI